MRATIVPSILISLDEVETNIHADILHKGAKTPTEMKFVAAMDSAVSEAYSEYHSAIRDTNGE